MIDILLVLIIIFMVNVMARKAVDLQLPVETRNTESTGEQIVLEVLPGNAFAINRQPIPARALEDSLRAIYRARPQKILFVKGDPRVTYQEVMTAIDVARGAGVVAIGIAPKDVH
jgi:biopolymer transport protein ExbD